LEEATMDADDLDPVKKKPVKKDLSRMSIGDLNAYISELREEISRTEGEIARKEKARAGADSFFKS